MQQRVKEKEPIAGSERHMGKHRAIVSGISLLMLIVTLCLSGCYSRRTVNEQETIKRIEPMTRWLRDYYYSFSFYPESTDDLVAWKGLPLPENPYTGRPMEALTEEEFDRERSPGNFCYVPVRHSGQIVGYLLHVYGEDGLLVTLNPNVRWDNIRDYVERENRRGRR